MELRAVLTQVTDRESCIKPAETQLFHILPCQAGSMAQAVQMRLLKSFPDTTEAQAPPPPSFPSCCPQHLDLACPCANSDSSVPLPVMTVFLPGAQTRSPSSHRYPPRPKPLRSAGILFPPFWNPMDRRQTAFLMRTIAGFWTGEAARDEDQGPKLQARLTCRLSLHLAYLLPSITHYLCVRKQRALLLYDMAKRDYLLMPFCWVMHCYIKYSGRVRYPWANAHIPRLVTLQPGIVLLASFQKREKNIQATIQPGNQTFEGINHNSQIFPQRAGLGRAIVPSQATLQPTKISLGDSFQGQLGDLWESERRSSRWRLTSSKEGATKPDACGTTVIGAG